MRMTAELLEDLERRAKRLAECQCTLSEIVCRVAEDMQIEHDTAEKHVNLLAEDLDHARESGKAAFRCYLWKIAGQCGHRAPAARIAEGLAFQYLGWSRKSIADDIADKVEKARQQAEKTFHRKALKAVSGGK